MTTRFGRSVRVTLASRPNKTGKFFDRYTRAIDIENLRVSFQVEKNLEKKGNKAKITIWNLKKDTRAEFQTQPANVHIQAGYGADLATLYKGDIYWGHSEKQAPEWVTTAECGAGLNFQRYSRTSISLKRGASKLDAIKQMAKDAGIPIPTNLESAKDFLGTIESGMVLEGPTLDQMNKLVKTGGAGFGMTVQDDRLVLLRDGDVLKARAIKVSKSTGMIGRPELGTPEKRGKPPVLTVTTLLAPDINPGGLIVMDSEDVKGNYRVRRVSHSGDTRGREWYTKLEATVYP